MVTLMSTAKNVITRSNSINQIYVKFITCRWTELNCLIPGLEGTSDRLNQMKWPGHYTCPTKYILNLEVSCKTNLTAKSRALPDSHHHG